MSCGLPLLAQGLPPRSAPAPDTLIVAGGEGTRAALADAALTAWLRAVAPRVRRLASVCTGAFLLAEAGLLDGPARDHALVGLRRARAPLSATCGSSPDPIFVRDGDV